MKVIAALDADLEQTPLGTASRLAEPVGDDSVLGMTVRRLARSKHLQGVYVLVPADQFERAAALLEGTPAKLRQHEAGAAPFNRLIRVARKWSLDGWRGGIGGAAAMDEYTHPRLLAQLARRESADAVFVLPPACPLVDPVLADAMIEHFRTVADEMRMTFTLAPPGLAGTIFRTGLLEELAEKNIPPGWTLSYKPDAPSIDLTMRKCCYQASEALRHSAGRLVADTSSSLDRVRRCLAAHRDGDAETVGRWIIDEEGRHVPALPREVEIELTTEDQLTGTMLRPRGAAVGRRGPIDVGMVRRVAQELSGRDDSLVVVGGFGEPLLHPAFEDVLHALRDSGVYGVDVRTQGTGLTDPVIEALIRNQVDVVSVTLDAMSPATYAQVHGSDAYSTVVGNIERLVSARDGKLPGGATRPPSVAPLVVPEFIKCRETLAEMEAFFDGWIRKVGWAVVQGYNHYGHRLEDRSVVDMTPPRRTACRRILARCLVTAAADVLLCDQDYAADRPAGNLAEATLAEIWRGSSFTAAREAHARGRHQEVRLCDRCEEWHRP